MTPLTSHRSVWFALVLGTLSLAFAARAAAPVGDIPTIVVGGAQSVFLLIGHSEQCDSLSGLDGCLIVDTVADGVGGITGSGMLQFSGIAEGDLPMTLVGKTTGTTENPVTNLKLAFEGILDIPQLGAQALTTGNGKLRCKGDDFTPSLSHCDVRMRICLKVEGLGRKCARAGIPDLEVEGQGGPFNLDLSLATDPMNKITGTGRVTLATGQLLDYDVTGKYSPKKALSNLTFKGIGAAKNAKLSLKGFASDASQGKLQFKLGGQKGKVDLVDLP